MKKILLQAKQIMQPNEAFHFTRMVLSRQPVHQRHSHDYYELFWLQHGQAKHLINDQIQNLTEGDLLFIRPTDCHALQGKGDETHVVNIIFPATLVDDIAARHGISKRFFWWDGPMPDITHRDIRQLANLSHQALIAETGPRTRLSAEAFLLPVLSELISTALDLENEVPAWLTKTCQAAQQPEIFRQGAAGLVHASGRSHAHVSRSFQQFLGKTPSDYVNKIRMTRASRGLVGSSDGLAEIAADCGISNLSHFHRLFRDTHGMTPNQYRKLFQKNAVQPI